MRKNQMHPVKRQHLISILGDLCISFHIMNRDFTKRINRKNDHLKNGIEHRQTHCFSQFTKLPFVKYTVKATKLNSIKSMSIK